MHSIFKFLFFLQIDIRNLDARQLIRYIYGKTSTNR